MYDVLQVRGLEISPCCAPFTSSISVTLELVINENCGLYPTLFEFLGLAAGNRIHNAEYTMKCLHPLKFGKRDDIYVQLFQKLGFIVSILSCNLLHILKDSYWEIIC